ncbi:MAG: RNA-binding S4 domain-containing protein [Bacteroidales bacterium]|nr:RNA-binding S4 domain-containing protein [Bacteroidales bacterium]
MDSVRLDKYLWAIRAFKTRSEASDACNGGKVRLGGVAAKAAKAVRIGDVLEVRKGPVSYVYRVLQLCGNRVGAALVPSYAEDCTPEGEKQKLHAPRQTVQLQRDRGAGRPTKKERRELDALLDAVTDGL